MLRKLIALTPGTIHRPETSGIEAYMRARLNEHGRGCAERAAEQIERHLKHFDLESVFSSSPVFCTQTAQIVAKMKDDTDVVHLSEICFEHSEIRDVYRPLIRPNACPPLAEFLGPSGERANEFAKFGVIAWNAVIEHSRLFHSHAGLAIMLPGLLQSMLLYAAPYKQREMIRKAIIRPCEGYVVAFDENAHLLSVHPLYDEEMVSA